MRLIWARNLNEWFAKFPRMFLKFPSNSFLYKPCKMDSISLLLTKLTINNHKIKREESIKFLRVLLDGNLTWKEHPKSILGILKTNVLKVLSSSCKCLLTLYYSYVQTYINYANKAWGSIHLTNLKKLHSKWKHAIYIAHKKDKF